jgi:DNA-binding HxlR family transcriptional regulator
MNVHHGCPVQSTSNILSGKWKVQAVWRLSFGPLRFAELRNLLRGVGEKESKSRSLAALGMTCIEEGMAATGE